MDLNNCYNIIIQLQSYKRDESEFIEISKAFFDTAYYSLIYKLVVETSKLFDEDKKNESMFQLLKDCQNNIAYLKETPLITNHFEKFNSTISITKSYVNASEMIEENLKKITELEEVLKPIKRQRNKIYAHADKIIAKNPSELYKNYPVKFNYFEKIFLTYTNICNDFCVLINEYTMFPFMQGVDDLSHMLFEVKKD